MTPKKVLLIVLSALTLALFEATFRTFLPFPWSLMRPLLALSVMFVVVGRVNEAILFTGVSALVADVFSLERLYAFPIVLMILLMLILLSQSVLTNRSIYAGIAMVAVGRFAEFLLLNGLRWLAEAYAHEPLMRERWTEMFVTMGWDVLCLLLSFTVFSFVTRHFFLPVNRDPRYV